MLRTLRTALAVAGLAVFCLGALGQTGYLSVTAANLKDFSGSPLANATITWAPVNNAGQPISAHIGASGGGQGVTRALTVNVVGGNFSLTVADTVLTSPINICYNVTVIDNATGNILLNYPCVQPASTGQTSWCNTTTCNFDAYTPTLPPGTVIATGPQGPQGPTGPNCSGSSPSGWCWLTSAVEIGTTANFNVSSLAQLNTAIASCSTSFCAFHIAGTVSFTASMSLPAFSAIYFEGGQFAGTGTINMNGAAIYAPSIQVIAGSIVLTNLSTVDPAWWGGRTSGTAFAAAVASLTSGGTVAMGWGTYESPATVSAANIVLKGVEMPAYNSGYTALTGGTIIQGVLQVNGNYDTVQDLGVDAGSAFQGATCTDGLDFNNSLTPGSTAIQRPIVKNVSILLSASTCANHGLLVENTNWANIQHVKMVYGIYGLILKSSNATARDVWACGTPSDAIYVKADSAFSGNITNILVDGYTVDSTCGTAPAGVQVEAQSATIAGVTLDHGLVSSNTGNSLNIEGDSGSFTLSDWNVDHFKSVNSGGVGIFVSANTPRGNIDHAIINTPSTQGVYSNGPSYPLNINDTVVTNSTVGGFYVASVSAGNVLISNSQVLGGTTPYGITVTAGVVDLVNFNATNGVTTVCVASGGTCSLSAIPIVSLNGTTLTSAPLIQKYHLAMTAGTVTQSLSGFTGTPHCDVTAVNGGAGVGTATPTVWISAESSSSVTANASSSGYTNGVEITCTGN